MAVSPMGAVLYCTTFPCHVCAKHIVGAGIVEVVFIEPYPKSKALELHSDSIAIEEPEPDHVVFRPFVGVAPRRFTTLFSMRGEDGPEIARKDENGRTISGVKNLRLRMEYFSAPAREALVAEEFESITTRSG
jgi:deoxycytidylate deaminase